MQTKKPDKEPNNQIKKSKLQNAEKIKKVDVSFIHDVGILHIVSNRKTETRSDLQRKTFISNARKSKDEIVFYIMNM